MNMIATIARVLGMTINALTSAETAAETARATLAKAGRLHRSTGEGSHGGFVGASSSS
jgi:hypothetical protein